MISEGINYTVLQGEVSDNAVLICVFVPGVCS